VKIKVLSITLVVVLLLAALMKISGVVHDRQTYRAIAVQSVAKSLAGPQTLTGPLIHRACKEEWDTLVDKQMQAERREFILVSPPATLDINGTSKLEPRARGLHATQVFGLKTQITAQWTNLETLQPKAEHANSRMTCGQPLLMLAVSDSRGIRHASLKLGSEAQALKSGTFYGSFPRGVHTALSQATVLSAPLQAQFDVELVGTEHISVVPLGGDTSVLLKSNWAHPSFNGQFSPVKKEVSDAGFEATWRVSSMASSAQQDIATSESVCAPSTDVRLKTETPCMEAFGVSFIDPGNTYAMSDRATKYGILFIGLTFLAVGLFEFMKSLRVHPIQYFLVGAAMSIFFLLLVSLSEHLPFSTAYAAAATACVLLLTFYASHMLRGWLRGVPFGAGIAMLYGMLFVLLQMEQTALVLGAVALFVILAIIMGLTRRVDWYARLPQSA
jgi:inner membrane protein